MEKYMNEARLLRDLNRSLDGDYQKLCDKYHNLELSHNRKKKALQEIRRVLYSLSATRNFIMPVYEISDIQLQALLLVIDDALFCDGRERSRPLVKRKSKGGAK